ncbi:MAG: sugar phosphate isomerase/epimerase [Alkalibacterium sp.]|nr:sugar phosphate isomerase/epimerase [Alkalibacterium sp.]
MRQVTYSTLPFIGLEPLKAIETCFEQGADKVEVFMEGPHWANLTRAGRIDLAQKLARTPFEFSVHPPQFDLNMASEWATIRETALAEYSKAIEFAGWIKASHVVINPGVRHLGVFDLSRSRLYAKEGIDTLLPLAENHQVQLGIENGGSKLKELFDEDSFVDFVKAFDHHLIGAVFDSGHARVTGWNTSTVIKALDTKLIALHLNDTSGNVDNHLSLGKGVIKWEGVFNAVRQLKHKPDLILELNTQSSIEQITSSKDFILRHLD